jgi:hypothetical protein
VRIAAFLLKGRLCFHCKRTRKPQRLFKNAASFQHGPSAQNSLRGHKKQSRPFNKKLRPALGLVARARTTKPQQLSKNAALFRMLFGV